MQGFSDDVNPTKRTENMLLFGKLLIYLLTINRQSNQLAAQSHHDLVSI